jgi:3-oxoacyl-[acyl-carrier-protein] synthase-3
MIESYRSVLLYFGHETTYLNVLIERMIHSIISSTGSYIPNQVIPNSAFLNHSFYDRNGRLMDQPNEEIIKKLYEITGIRERRYADDELCTSDIAYNAAVDALGDTDRESLDYIIVAHNFGDVRSGGTRVDQVPTIASRVKHRLGINNPYCVAYDIPFGCPGWLQGMIMADYYIRSGDVQRVLVIGAETLSRLYDPHDVDSMIYADGAGATVVESADTDHGIISHVSRTDAVDHAYLLKMGPSYNPDKSCEELFIKMCGHDIYRYATKTVPLVIRQSLEKVGLSLEDVNKVIVHQANEKMDQAILKRLFSLYGVRTIPETIMPMMISWAGNSSVATLPTLLDLILKEKLDDHQLNSGDIAVFASVGAGMNVNAMVYRMP